jgi:hypothetical protein
MLFASLNLLALFWLTLDARVFKKVFLGDKDYSCSLGLISLGSDLKESHLGIALSFSSC